jgi:hypothetical protein
MNELNYRCCFCNQLIEPSKTDPADVNVLINIDKGKEQQYNQTFYCHTQCFREKMHLSMQMHFHLHNILDD